MSTAAKDHRMLFLCCLTDARDESCIDFAMMLLALPGLAPNVNVHVHFAHSLQDGLRSFLAMQPGDDAVFVAMDTMMAGTGFVAAALASSAKHQLCFAVHQKPPIDWARVAAGLTPYQTTFADLVAPKPADRGYVPLVTTDAWPAPQDTKALWLKGSVLNALGHTDVWQWTGQAHVDTSNELSVMGKQPFTGCVGHRASIR
jgi:hypothetical protein